MSYSGWPPSPLAQDHSRALFEWFASKPDARRLVREHCAAIAASAGAGGGERASQAKVDEALAIAGPLAANVASQA